MQRALIVTGVLGLGTAIVFGAAGVAAAMFPNGGTVPAGWNGGVMVERGVAMPAPMPANPGVAIDVAPTTGQADAGGELP